MEEAQKKKRKPANRGVNNGQMGRPIIEIDWLQLDKLCELQCTLNEIAGWFNASEDTIEKRVSEKFGCTFTDYRSKKSARGKIGLRRKQMQAAMGGNTALLIWLGKQYLDQAEPEIGSKDTDILEGFTFVRKRKAEE